MKTIKELNKTAFKRWLKGHDPAEAVGESGYCVECPIYNFLKTTSVMVNDVEEYTIEVFNPKTMKEETIAAPAWVSDFIDAIDEYSFAHITASHALAVLKTV